MLTSLLLSIFKILPLGQDSHEDLALEEEIYELPPLPASFPLPLFEVGKELPFALCASSYAALRNASTAVLCSPSHRR